MLKCVYMGKYLAKLCMVKCASGVGEGVWARCQHTLVLWRHACHDTRLSCGATLVLCATLVTTHACLVAPRLSCVPRLSQHTLVLWRHACLVCHACHDTRLSCGATLVLCATLVTTHACLVALRLSCVPRLSRHTLVLWRHACLVCHACHSTRLSCGAARTSGAVCCATRIPGARAARARPRQWNKTIVCGRADSAP
jgi:hypothetical protein